jgi:hypothetical protein
MSKRTTAAHDIKAEIEHPAISTTCGCLTPATPYEDGAPKFKPKFNR